MLRLILQVIVMSGALVVSGCSLTKERGVSPPTPASTGVVEPARVFQSKVSSIRSVDFNNFSYQNYPDYSGDKKRLITLSPGEAGPEFVDYGDVTGDGSEEAFVVLPIEVNGTAAPHIVYIYTLQNNDLKLLWSFETGDRADGGLRNIGAEGGELVVELFGARRAVGSNLYKGDEPLCCPKWFTRTHYKWTGKKFVETRQEVSPNPISGTDPTMPSYRKQNQ